MKKIYTSLLLSGLFLFATVNSQANGLVINNLTRVAANQTINFDIQWFNSWRVDSSGSPYNWDAAWVFVKFRECGAPSTTAWTHAKIDPVSGFNAFGDLEPHSHGGTYWSDSLGVMLRRGVNGIFPNQAATNITLAIQNLPTTGSYDVKVFGIENVYVPQGAFEIGFASGNYYSFNDGTRNPQTITSEAAVTTYAYYNNNNTYRTYNIPGSFPKGYDAFYSMKYEISQGQYCAFLNTLTTPAQLVRYLGYYNTYRNRSTNTGVAPNIYVSDRPDRAQNCMNEYDLMAYLDWAALRPMTELEYEKSCRGEAPSIQNEYAWGTTAIYQGTTISTSPEDGTERISSPANANCNYYNNNFGGGDGSNGPLRVGIFADPTDNDRMTTGATYYGIMEMTGNVSEMCSSVGYSVYQGINDGTLGDGYLTTSGNHNAANWITGTYSFIYKGGSYYDNSGYQLNVSSRYLYSTNPTRIYSGYAGGGRGVR